MELKQVKALLHQTECGEMFMDGMGCSEPILTQGNAGLIDNFFDNCFLPRDCSSYKVFDPIFPLFVRCNNLTETKQNVFFVDPEARFQPLNFGIKRFASIINSGHNLHQPGGEFVQAVESFL